MASSPMTLAAMAGGIWKAQLNPKVAWPPS